MQMNGRMVARSFMQVINVLRDDRQLWHPFFHFGNRYMRRIGLRLHDFSAQPFVPSPGQLRVAQEAIGCGHVLCNIALP